MQDIVRKIFSNRTLGIAELETNVLVLDSQLQGQRTTSKLLAAADVVVSVAGFLNKWPGLGIGVSVGAVVDAMDVYRKEMQQNDGLVGENTIASLVAASSDLIAGISGAVAGKSRLWPLAAVSAGFKMLSVAAKHLSIHASNVDQVINNLKNEQNSLLDSLKYQTESRRDAVIKGYESLIRQEAAKVGVDFSTVIDNGFSSEVDGLIDLLNNEINAEIEKSKLLRVDLSIDQIEEIKDEYIGDFNTILGGYGDGGRVNGILNTSLGIAVKKSRTKILDAAHNDFIEEIEDADLNRAQVLDFSAGLKDALRQANLKSGSVGGFVDKWIGRYQQALSSTRSNLIADSLSYKNGVLNGGMVLVEEVNKDLVQDYLNKRNELNEQYQMFEKLEKNRQIDLAHRDVASLVIENKKVFMEDVRNMHQTSAEYLRQKAIRLAAKANSKEGKVPDSIFNKLSELHQEINNQIDNSRAATSNVLDSYLSNFTDLTHFLNISDIYIKEEHHRLNDGFGSIISLLESIIDQLEELLDEEPDDEEQDSDNDGIPDDIDPDQDGDNDPNNHDDDSGSTGGEGGTQGDAVHEGSNNSDRQRRIDPLVLDLDGDGLDFLSLDNSQAKFDLTGNGFATHTSWLSGDDGFLAIDKNNDGSINNIDELFGREDATGFEELELLDSNGDGKISIEDAAFEQLLIWQDKNGDGASTQEELKKLSDYNITEISLDRSASGAEKNDVLLEEVGHYVTVDANGNRQEYLLGDVLFSTRPTYSEFVGEVTLTDAAKAIANIQGYGMMPNLNAAMSLNKEFEAQILQFTRDLSSQTLTSGFDDILYGWAGSKGLTLTDIDSTPNLSADENRLVRFPNANVTLSIQQLGVLKAYTGINTLEIGDGIWNANGKTHTTGQLYLEAWNSIRANLMAKFAVSQGLLEHLIPSVTYDAASDTLQSTFDFKSRADAIFQKVASKLGNLKTANDAAELLLVLDVFEQFESGFSKTQKECVIDLIKSAEPVAYDWLANNIDLVKKIDNSILLGRNIQGTSGADVAIGSRGDDLIHTGAGDDVIEGRLGNDTLHGGDGNDQLFGGEGNDTLTVNGRGSNKLDGDAGDDTLKINRSTDYNYNSGVARNATNTLTGGVGNDRLEGSVGAET
ncbi:calcium-binding protein, partial [Vibrio vulnificus]